MINKFQAFFLSERNILWLILINSFVIFLLYFPAMENHRWLLIVDNCILLLFVVEMIVKIHLLKPSGYFADRWNQFDFLVVVLSLPSLIEGILDIPSTSLLLVLRLLRVIRLVRFFRFVPNLGMILSGLGRALKSSVFVFVALVFFNFLIALITCHFYREIAPEYFKDPLLSAYSIFQMFTKEGWNEIPALIADRSESVWIVGFTRFYFVMVVLFGGILGVSLANAIFVDEMTMDNNKELELKINRLEDHILTLQEMLRDQQNKDA